MKSRNGFVSNSSSTSFIISVDKDVDHVDVHKVVRLELDDVLFTITNEKQLKELKKTWLEDYCCSKQWVEDMCTVIKKELDKGKKVCFGSPERGSEADDILLDSGGMIDGLLFSGRME